MKKRLAIPLLILVVLLITAIPALAATVYKAPLSISENTSVAYEMIGVGVPSPNQFLSDNGFFVNAEGLDTRVETLGGLAKVHMIADNYTWFAIPVPADSQTNLFYTMGNSLLTFFRMIFGVGSYVTVADNATIELGDNFSVTVDGWWDTDNGTNKNAVYKYGAFELFVSPTVSENITASIADNTTSTLTLSPNGSGNLTQLTPSAGDNWECVDDAPPLGAGADGTDVRNLAPPALQRDLYSLTNLGTNLRLIDSVKVYFRAKEQAGTGKATPYLFLDGDTTTGTEIDITGAWANYDEELARPGGGSWTYTDINNLEAGIGLRETGGGSNTFCSQLYIEVSYYDQTSVTATSVASGEHEIEVAMDSPFLSMGVDATSDPIIPVSANLTLNLPLWQTESDNATFTSIDTTKHGVTVTNAIWSSSGYVFDGAGDYLTLPAGVSWDFADNFSIEVWLYLDTLNRNIIKSTSTGNWGTAAAGDWLLDVDGSGKTTFYVKGGITARAVTAIVANTWYHVTLTRIGNNIAIYRNGADDTLGSPVQAGGIGNTQVLELGRNEVTIDLGMDGLIAEVRVYNGLGLSPAQVLSNYDATKTKYDVSGDIYTYSTLSGVPDNANDYVFMQNDVLPYADNITISVDGTQQLYFAPNAMILGTNLPDRAGDNDGTITWGTNPAGVSVSLGSLISESTDASGVTAERATRDLLPPAGGSDWSADPAVAAELLTHPLRPFIVMVSDSTALTESQVWLFYGVTFVLLIMALVFKNIRHKGILGVALCVAVGAVVAQSVFPIFALVVTILVVILVLVSERSPSL